MRVLRRLLGILVMIAGVLGLVLSLAGLVGVWVVKPVIASNVTSIIVTINTSVTTSQKAMEVTGQALGAMVDSVDALSSMLGATAHSLQDTQPVLDQLNTFMSEKLPATVESATSSLETAQQAAVVLDSAIKSLETFRAILAGVPFVGSLVEQPAQTYNPEKPLAESLGELADNLKDLPDLFTDISADMDRADDNLATIQSNLTTMSDSVILISNSLREYEGIINQSQSSMDSVVSILTNFQNSLAKILDGTAIVFSLFFFWLLAAQAVILSQGWELYQGAAILAEVNKFV